VCSAAGARRIIRSELHSDRAAGFGADDVSGGGGGSSSQGLGARRRRGQWRRARSSGQTAMADKTYQRTFIEAAVEPQFDWTPEKFWHFLDNDIERWSPSSKRLG
jgi:hypothetical protein